MKRPLPVATCLHCGCEFVKHDRVKARRYCSRECSNSGRWKNTARRAAHKDAVPDTAVPDTTAPDTDYPGTEWGPLPPALLVKVAAHVLAAEYAAWAAQQKARAPAPAGAIVPQTRR